MRAFVSLCVLGITVSLAGCFGEVSRVVRPENVADDPAFAEAAAQAKATFSEFVTAWRTKRRSNMFQVMKAFESEVGGLVYVWIEVTDLTGGVIKGKLREIPEFPIGLDVGDKVSVDRDEIVDWLYYNYGGEVTGDFTTDAYTAYLVKKRG